MNFPQTSGNHVAVVEIECPQSEKRVTSNKVAQQHTKPLYPIIVEGNANIQDRTLYHIIDYVLENVVPNFPQR